MAQINPKRMANAVTKGQFMSKRYEVQVFHRMEPHKANNVDTVSTSAGSESLDTVPLSPAGIPVDPASTKPITRPTKLLELSPHQPLPLANTFTSSVLQIPLDQDERRLFDTLLKAAKAFQEGLLDGNLTATSPTHQQHREPVTIRVAGGWVRDKILGLSTHDVDVALDTVTGVEMAHILRQYLTDIEKEDCGRIGVIAANPAQSKHLETATMKVHGIEVDFANLRHETYAADSRIPETVLGTPLEDSYRRDFTMNALYYNLHTREVEDWTARGLKDLLDTKLVVTPLNAHHTFQDDPLRVLRAIRFAVRYSLELSQDLDAACRDVNIHHELLRKVSRERVGKELEGMLSGKHAKPQQALTLLCELGLASTVFALPPLDQAFHGYIAKARLDHVPYNTENADERVRLHEQAWKEAQECLFELPETLQMFSQSSAGHTVVDHRLVYLATILLPFYKVQYTDKKKVKYVVEYVMREAVKFKNKDVQGIVTIAERLDDMVHILQQPPELSPTTRLQAGLLLRQCKELWPTLMVLASVALGRKTSSPITWGKRAANWHTIIVNDLELDQCWTIKPLMNGKQLMQTLSLPNGPLVGIFNQEQIRWMLIHPTGTVEDCQLHLKAFQRNLETDQTTEHIPKKVHI